jgi:hypothetical protein
MAYCQNDRMHFIYQSDIYADIYNASVTDLKELN